MSSDIEKSELVGVTLPPQMIARIDEHRQATGQTRQEVIRQAIVKDLFQSC